MATFGDAEEKYTRLLAVDNHFVLSGSELHLIRKSGRKHYPQREPKNDIYVLAGIKDRALPWK